MLTRLRKVPTLKSRFIFKFESTSWLEFENIIPSFSPEKLLWLFLIIFNLGKRKGLGRSITQWHILRKVEIKCDIV